MTFRREPVPSLPDFGSLVYCVQSLYGFIEQNDGTDLLPNTILFEVSAPGDDVEQTSLAKACFGPHVLR